MLYALVRALNSICLRWFYSRVDAEGVELVPPTGPVILAVNHPNSLVDSMVVAETCGRRLTFTGRATLFTNPIRAWFLRSVGVVPLIRQKDVAVLGASAATNRNEGSFDALIGALEAGGAMMIHPEGITGDHLELAPLKTGAARLALQARDAGIAGIKLVPVGLTFEQKDEPRSRVLAQVGETIDIDAWPLTEPQADARAITDELTRRLRSVTLNYRSATEVDLNWTLARRVAQLFRSAESVPEVWHDDPTLATDVAIARRIEAAWAKADSAPQDVRDHAHRFTRAVRDFSARLTDLGLRIDDLEIPLGVAAGAWFTVREIVVLALAGPFALWGWLNHLLPFSLARAIGLKNIETAADPAMRTIVSGIGLVLAFYVVQAGLVWSVFGGWVAFAYLVSLPVAAEINFTMRARLARAVGRAKAYLALRANPALRQQLGGALSALRSEAVAIEALLTA